MNTNIRIRERFSQAVDTGNQIAAEIKAKKKEFEETLKKIKTLR